MVQVAYNLVSLPTTLWSYLSAVTSFFGGYPNPYIQHMLKVFGAKKRCFRRFLFLSPNGGGWLPPFRTDFAKWGTLLLLACQSDTSKLGEWQCYPLLSAFLNPEEHQTHTYATYAKNLIPHPTELRLRLKKPLQLPLVWQNFSFLGLSVIGRCSNICRHSSLPASAVGGLSPRY